MPDEEFRRLAAFRVLLRQFQFFSEQAAQVLGLTSLQYQTLLAIKAHEELGPVTMTALSQALIIKHNSAVGLIDRIEQLGLVTRRHPESDRRSVVVELTPRGRRIVGRLASQHRIELQRVAGKLGRHAGQFAKPVAEAA
ncbi:MAG: MarR family transcriptional regulator [Pseudomonadota bacterium]|nr:MarR family transcriptional regulator [Pseudomonadota bacterium]